MSQNAADNLEEREQQLREMELAAAHSFQQQQSEIAEREAAVERREQGVKDREDALDVEIAAREEGFVRREAEIKVREDTVRASEKRLAAERAEFAAEKQATAAAPAASMTPPETPRGRSSPESIHGRESIDALEKALEEQSAQFQSELQKALASQREKFEAQTQDALAAQAAQFEVQLQQSEARAGSALQEAEGLRQELRDKADEYEVLTARETSLAKKEKDLQSLLDDAQEMIKIIEGYDVVNISDEADTRTISEEKKRSWKDTVYSAQSALSNIALAVGAGVVSAAAAAQEKLRPKGEVQGDLQDPVRNGDAEPTTSSPDLWLLSEALRGDTSPAEQRSRSNAVDRPVVGAHTERLAQEGASKVREGQDRAK